MNAFWTCEVCGNTFPVKVGTRSLITKLDDKEVPVVTVNVTGGGQTIILCPNCAKKTFDLLNSIHTEKKGSHEESSETKV